MLLNSFRDKWTKSLMYLIIKLHSYLSYSILQDIRQGFRLKWEVILFTLWFEGSLLISGGEIRTSNNRISGYRKQLLLQYKLQFIEIETLFFINIQFQCFSFLVALHKNLHNTEVVSHTELKGILTDFKHSVIGSVKASMLDAMRLQRKQKEKRRDNISMQPSTSSVNPMVDSSSDEDDPLMENPDYSDSDVEEWWVPLSTKAT